MVIGIYGLGRFGSFWASLLSTITPVQGWSREGFSPMGISSVTEKEVCQSDVLFLCNSISSMEEVCERIAPLLSPHTLVVDTCSVKVYPLEMMRKYLPEVNPLAGTHPMFGPDSGRNGVKGLPLVFCRERGDDLQMRPLLELFKVLEVKLVELSDESHDHQAAYSQGVTHFIGRTLDLMHLEATTISTKGYGDLLHIVEQTCNDKWQLFLDLQKYNPYTGEMRKRLHSSIEEMLKKLDSIDSIGD